MPLSPHAAAMIHDTCIVLVLQTGTGQRQHKLGAFVRSIEALALQAEQKLGLAPGSFDFHDEMGRIDTPQDLNRALRSAAAERQDCTLQVREQGHYLRLRSLEAEVVQLKNRKQPDDHAQELKQEFKQQLNLMSSQITNVISKLDKKIEEEVKPEMDSQAQGQNALSQQMTAIQQKLSGLDVEELRSISNDVGGFKKVFLTTIERIDRMEAAFAADSARILADNETMRKALGELERYIHGKIEVCIEADGDLRKGQQIIAEKIGLVADDLRVLQRDLRMLGHRCHDTLEAGDGMRTLLGAVREDNLKLTKQCNEMVTRMRCVEYSAEEKWEGFFPGVIYFRKWHKEAKGGDVQLNADLSVATGRGFLSATGFIMGSDEGLCVADGPCRRFGTSSAFSTYFEIEVDEITSSPAGSGGLYVGVAIQSAEEIHAHPKHEFDGWLLGGPSKAVFCRAGSTGVGLEEAEYDGLIPGSVPQPRGDQKAQLGTTKDSDAKAAADAVQLLRAALPPRSKGEITTAPSTWSSESLRMGDRVGVVFQSHREGGARLRVVVNGNVVGQHEFRGAPPAQALSLLHPVVRLAGTSKAVRLRAGITPPGRVLGDDPRAGS